MTILASTLRIPRLGTLVLAVLLPLLWLAPLAQAQGMPRTLSTGVGKEERVAHADYAVRLEFALLNGAYLAEVRVRIVDADGKRILDTVSDGPWLFVDLAPGAYRVVATARDRSAQSASFTRESGRQKVVRLVWR